MTITKRTGSQQVAVAWLKTLPNLSGVPVASTLAPMAQWAGQDFVVVTFGLGGIPDPYLLTHVPVMQIDCFAKPPTSSNKPAWNRASMTAECIRDACYTAHASGILHFTGGFPDVHLDGVAPKSEPRRVLSDLAAFARYSIDLEFSYSPISVLV